MTNWLMAAPLHITDINSQFIGKPWRYDVLANKSLRIGDLVYLITQSGLYGWGYITKIEPKDSASSEKEMYIVTVTRPVVRDGIASMPVIEQDEDLAGVMSRLEGNFAELAPSQVNACNRLFRLRGESAPDDVDEYADQIGNFGFRTTASFQAKLRRAVTNHQRASVFFLDLDNFKSVNDHYDHETGDSVIREALTVMQETLGEVGEVFHRSGDEILILVPELDHARSAELAERVRAAIEKHPFQTIGQGRVTTTVGFAHFPDTCEDWQDLDRLADATAMKAKKVRKNWVATPQSNFDVIPPVTAADIERAQLEIQRLDVMLGDRVSEAELKGRKILVLEKLIDRLKTENRTATGRELEAQIDAIRNEGRKVVASVADQKADKLNEIDRKKMRLDEEERRNKKTR